ncbi:hypothetical protein FQA39_LY11488 [Lamprigera yunnana]|nr:hypothetical protein FQA39_LY11488 [Lamprigera yunnana]
MYKVVCFKDLSVAIIREEWLTPRKTETFWPPYKHSVDYQRCLSGKEVVNDKWPIYNIIKHYYATDDLLKARQQLKRAECESDLNTDEEGSLKRKRKQKQYSSSDENDDNGVTIKNRLSTQIPSPPPPTSNQGNTSTDLEKHVTILETQDNSTHFTQALENVAKKLAKICQRLDAIEENQRKILEKVGNECSEPVQEVQNLPEGKHIEIFRRKNLKAVVHRVLEKIFSAKVVPLCNWTGKYQKTALKNLLVTQIIIHDLLKARQQLKRAECESDLNTDEEGSLKRKRKQKQYSSSDENDDNGVTIKNRLSTQIPSPPPPTSNQGNTSTDLEKHVTILETQDNSTHFTQALENVAKKLAKICQRLDAIEENQRKILEKVGNECSEPVQEVQNLPEGLIPCSSLDEIKRLENWLKEAVHEATLVWISYL